MAGQSAVRAPQGPFMLRMEDDSLEAEGIRRGDHVAVEPSPDIIDGKIYAVQGAGEGIKLLRVYNEGSKLRLMSPTGGHWRLIEPGEVEILGRVTKAGRYTKYK